jgi:hypothetical protein
MTLKMTKPGYRNDFIFKGTCKDCGAEFEADPSECKMARQDQNCGFCSGVRTVRLEPTAKKQLLNG